MMKTLTIRPTTPTLDTADADFTRIAQLLSTDANETTTTADLLGEYAVAMEGRTLRHAVATTNQNQVVGFSFAGHYPSMPTGQYYVNVVVDPAHRQQGIGTQLWDEVATHLRGQNAESLLAETQELDPAHRAFAEKRGFSVRTHELHATLDLSTFDADKFAGITEQVEAAGIHLTSFADIEQSEENTRKLYDINGIAALDDPASDGGYIGYENWKKVIFGGSWFQPAGQMIAMDGEKIVALSAITYDKDENVGHTLISGTDAVYRNRKIMQALKLRVIDYAKNLGANKIDTNIEVRNAPMRAINKKLGFVEEAGRFELEGSL